jgi:hypothetical protein
MRRLILGCALLWGGLGLLVEMSRAVAEHDRRESRLVGEPELWRLGTPEPDRFERCLAGVRQVLPAGDTIAFASGFPDPSSRFFAWRWAAYLLPDYDVAPWEDLPKDWRVAAVAAWGVRLGDPRYEPVRRSPGCTIYRVRP